MFVCVMVFEADVMLVLFLGRWRVPRCGLRESFPGESILLCEAMVCLLEIRAVIDQLQLDFVFVIVKLAITISCDVI